MDLINVVLKNGESDYFVIIPLLLPYCSFFNDDINEQFNSILSNTNDSYFTTYSVLMSLLYAPL